MTFKKPFQLILVTFLIFLLVILSISVANKYVKHTLSTLEHAHVCYKLLTFLFLFTLVSFPMTWGYIILNLAAGYLFGAFFGLLIISSCALVGISIAHYIIRQFMPTCTLPTFHQTSIHSPYLSLSNIKSLVGVVEGKDGFKLIALTRLTPIPFGLQNTFFAMCKVDYRRYVLASAAGMLPTQGVHAAIGSTIRTMKDVLSTNKSTYFILSVHIIILVMLFIGIGAKARREFLKSIHSSNQQPPTITTL